MEQRAIVDIAYSGPVVASPRWRTAGSVILVIVLLGAVTAIAAASRRSIVPSPFGPARNGLITWAIDGDVFAGDPAAGTVRSVVAGDDIDRNPTFSLDGTHLAFLRQVPSETGKFDLVVARPDGTAPRYLTPVPVSTPDLVEWAPDAASLLVNEPDGRVTRYFLDGSAPRVLLEHAHIEPDAFRPPDGAQLLYRRDDDQGALYVMNQDGSDAHELVGPRITSCACAVSGPARWSPDGQWVALSLVRDGVQRRLFVVNADGTGLRQLADERGSWTELDPHWSPDGTLIAFNRCQPDEAGDSWTPRAVAVAGVASGALGTLGVAPPAEGALLEWAPDGTSILSLPGTLAEAFTGSPEAPGSVARPTLFDLPDGSPRQLNWSVGSSASWQRLVP
jgi:dipeptidyl aminopeptidase/acylaminoacyl peptidase